MAEFRARRRASEEAKGAAQPKPKPKPRGRVAKKTELFIKAEQLVGTGRTWPQIAEKLIPEEAKNDRRAAGERLRVGVYDLKQKRAKLQTIHP
jgi:hypothetical protein